MTEAHHGSGAGTTSSPDPDHPAVPPVVRLGNDIARQFAHLPDDEAAAAVGKHIRMFWDPRMRAQLDAEIARDPTQLDPLVVTAITHRTS